jgi:hypothetical protein
MRIRLLPVVLAALVSLLALASYAAETLPKMSAPQAEGVLPVKQAAADSSDNYLTNRVDDFLDILDLKLLMGDSGTFFLHVRATRFLQLGLGRFCGTKVGFDGSCSGTYGEGRIEAGLSVFYWSWIGRHADKKLITADAEKRNWFFSQIDDITDSSKYREYFDGNRPWHTIGATLALPFLPGLEAYINPAEAVDFVFSLFGTQMLRVPPPFRKHMVNGERIPDPSTLRWHGQEQYEQYD